MEELFRFVGFSALCFPSILILSWLVFLVLQKFNWPRTTTIFVSCGLVVAVLYILEMQGRNWIPPSDTTPQIYEVVNGILAALVGLTFWGRKKTIQTTAPPDPAQVKPTKKEEGDRDRFICYLKATENINYVSVAQDVPSRGNKNFDYLLQGDNGELLALEITWLTDKDETTADKTHHHDFLEQDQKFQILINFLSSLISKMERPGSLFVGVPYHLLHSRKELNRLISNNVEAIKNQLSAVQSLSVGDCISVTTDVCDLRIECTGEGDTVFFYNIGGHRGGIFDLDYFAAKVRTKIPRKNQQLDFPAAKRRVLLIRNTIALIFDSPFTKLVIPAAITDFIAASPSDIENIDEIYVDFKLGEIERVYPPRN